MAETTLYSSFPPLNIPWYRTTYYSKKEDKWGNTMSFSRFMDKLHDEYGISHIATTAGRRPPWYDEEGNIVKARNEGDYHRIREKMDSYEEEEQLFIRMTEITQDDFDVKSEEYARGFSRMSGLPFSSERDLVIEKIHEAFRDKDEASKMEYAYAVAYYGKSMVKRFRRLLDDLYANIEYVQKARSEFLKKNHLVDGVLYERGGEKVDGSWVVF